MKKILIALCMLGVVVGLFATSSFNTANHNGTPVTKQVSSKMKVKEPKKICSAATDAILQGIANCYGINASLVCCITASQTYSIPSIPYVGSFTISDCGKPCTTICITVYTSPGTPQCCFDIPYEYPE